MKVTYIKNDRKTVTTKLMGIKREINIMNKSLLIAFITGVKLTISLKDTIHQNSHERK